MRWRLWWWRELQQQTDWNMTQSASIWAAAEWAGDCETSADISECSCSLYIYLTAVMWICVYLVQISSGKYPGLVWDDDAKTMFRIPWKHAGKQDFRKDEDAAIFKVKMCFLALNYLPYNRKHNTPKLVTWSNNDTKPVWQPMCIFLRRGQSSKGSWQTGNKTTRPPGRPVCAAPSTRVQSFVRWWNGPSWTSLSPTRCTASSPSVNRVRHVLIHTLWYTGS